MPEAPDTEARVRRYTVAWGCPLIKSLPCTKLEIGAEEPADWQKLEQLVSDPTRFPQLRKIEIHWTPGSDHFSTDSQVYTNIRNLLVSRGVKIDFHVEPGPVVPEELVTWLGVCSNEIVRVDTSFESVVLVPPSDFQPILDLPRLNYMRIHVDEGFDSQNFAAHRSIGAMLQRIKAPLLEKLHLDLATPYTDYLVHLTRAIREGIFPRLTQISGTYRIQRCFEGWNSTVAERRRAYFIRACRLAKLHIAGPEWQARLPKKEDSDSDMDF